MMIIWWWSRWWWWWWFVIIMIIWWWWFMMMMTMTIRDQARGCSLKLVILRVIMVSICLCWTRKPLMGVIIIIKMMMIALMMMKLKLMPVIMPSVLIVVKNVYMCTRWSFLWFDGFYHHDHDHDHDDTYSWQIGHCEYFHVSQILLLPSNGNCEINCEITNVENLIRYSWMWEAQNLSQLSPSRQAREF